MTPAEALQRTALSAVTKPSRTLTEVHDLIREVMAYGEELERARCLPGERDGDD